MEPFHRKSLAHAPYVVGAPQPKGGPPPVLSRLLGRVPKCQRGTQDPDEPLASPPPGTESDLRILTTKCWTEMMDLEQEMLRRPSPSPFIVQRAGQRPREGQGAVRAHSDGRGD